ncbi:MAG: YggU family protein [Acidobacteria bacterium]|nr:YggU family protein [Acidobacteriota bacterium]
MLDIRTTADGVEFSVRVVPRASKSEIIGVIDGAVKVRLKAPPVDGAANGELIKLFAGKLGVAKSDVEIVSGLTSKTKRLRVSDVTVEALNKLLN